MYFWLLLSNNHEIERALTLYKYTLQSINKQSHHTDRTLYLIYSVDRERQSERTAAPSRNERLENRLARQKKRTREH